MNKFGAKFGLNESTIDVLLTSTVVYNITDVEMSKIMGVARKRIASAKHRRGVFDDIADKAEIDNENCDSDSIDESIDELSDIESDNQSRISVDSNFNYFSDNEKEEKNENENENEKEKEKEKRKNIFEAALSPKCRKERKDKLNLEVVRDFCHDQCRLDTFSTTRILVQNYDDSHTYHDLHIRSKSLIEYYKIFENSFEYSNWKNDNKRLKNTNRNSDKIYNFPTIKFRSFTNAFCPCCLDQKQRDCANYVQVNLTNALKALGNLIKFHSISNAIKTCENEDYLMCHTSLRKFTNAILCPAIEHESISGDYKSLDSISE